MKGHFLNGVILLLIVCGNVIAGDSNYRIAGLIASGATGWQAIIELPDGQQSLVNEGDFLGQIKVVRISKDGVTLLFPDGDRQLQLSEGDYIAQPDTTVSRPQRADGVPVGDFSKSLQKLLSPEQIDSVSGLETLNRLPASARIVSYSYIGDPEAEHTPIDSLSSGVDLLREAIVNRKELRISVQGDAATPDFYVMPRQQE